MALTHLLDTSVYSQPIRHIPDPIVIQRWSAIGDAGVCTSTLCLAEVLKGLELRKSKTMWQRYETLLRNNYVLLPFDSETARFFALSFSALSERGTPRPIMDLLIAASALQHNLTLATLKRNQTLKDALDLMAYFRKVGEPGDPTEANELFGPPTTTLEAWLQG